MCSKRCYFQEKTKFVISTYSSRSPYRRTTDEYYPTPLHPLHMPQTQPGGRRPSHDPLALPLSGNSTSSKRYGQPISHILSQARAAVLEDGGGGRPCTPRMGDGGGEDDEFRLDWGKNTMKQVNRSGEGGANRRGGGLLLWLLVAI